MSQIDEVVYHTDAVAGAQSGRVVLRDGDHAIRRAVDDAPQPRPAEAQIAARKRFADVPYDGSTRPVRPNGRRRQRGRIDVHEVRLQTLDDALRKLPSEAQRQTVTRQLAGQSDAEIAHALGRSKGAVYSLRHRALRASRAILESRSDVPSHWH